VKNNEIADGTQVRVDARIFHRSGLDGTCHVQTGVRMFVEPDGHNPNEGEGEITLLLTPDERDSLYESYVPLLDGMIVPEENPASHPQVAELEVLE